MQIKELLKKPLNKTLLAKAILHQNKIAFHSEYNDSNPYKKEFAKWCKSMLDDSKQVLFDKYFITPHQNINFTGSIYSQYRNIFNSRNSYFNYSFKNTEHSKEFKTFLSEIKDREYWKTKGFETLRKAHNSIIVITADETTEGYFMLNINNVVDVSNTDVIEYLIYKIDEDTYMSYTDTSIIKWFKEGSEYTIIEEVEHNLGFCPVAWFWNESLNEGDYITKKHPLTDSLGELDWLLFGEISKNHSDLYSLYPIIATYSTGCDYEDSAHNKCENGYMYKSDDSGTLIPLLDGNTRKECPICGTSKLTGAGTVVEFDPPSEQDGTDLINGIKFVTAPTDNITLIEDKIKYKKDYLYTILTGASVETTKEAINEKQVLFNNSDKETILTQLAYTFSLAQKSTNDMLAVVKYDDYNGSDVNYGNKFYIYTSEDLYKMYLGALEKGVNESQLQEIRLQIIETNNRENPNEFLREMMLLVLEPLPYITDKSELRELAKEGLIDRLDVVIQNYFMYFVSQFELENGKIQDYEPLIDFDKRILKIKEALATMASAKINNQIIENV